MPGSRKQRWHRYVAISQTDHLERPLPSWRVESTGHYSAPTKQRLSGSGDLLEQIKGELQVTMRPFPHTVSNVQCRLRSVRETC